MSPVAVYLTEEAWHELGGEGSIHDQPWCKWDENLAKASSITLVVQINGKVKDYRNIAFFPTGFDKLGNKAVFLFLIQPGSADGNDFSVFAHAGFLMV